MIVELRPQVFLSGLCLLHSFSHSLQLFRKVIFVVFHLTVNDSYVYFVFDVSLEHIDAQHDLICVQIALFAARLTNSSETVFQPLKFCFEGRDTQIMVFIYLILYSCNLLHQRVKISFVFVFLSQCVHFCFESSYSVNGVVWRCSHCKRIV